MERRLAAKARARAAPADRPSVSARGDVGGDEDRGELGVRLSRGRRDLTRFADVHAANEVTRRGRETLELMCRELAARGVTLLEADTDGVYFAVPEGWTEADERRVVAEVAALLPPLVQLEFEGRYAAMLSHEPKNYALLTYDGTLMLRGVAFRSSRAEPFGEAFLRRAIGRLLVGDVAGCEMTMLRPWTRCAGGTADLRRLVQGTADQDTGGISGGARRRRELPYEAMLASGRTNWSSGDRVRVYRTKSGAGGVIEDEEEGSASIEGRRDYDVDHYARLLRDTYAARLERAFTAETTGHLRGSRPGDVVHAAGGRDPHRPLQNGVARATMSLSYQTTLRRRRHPVFAASRSARLRFFGPGRR